MTEVVVDELEFLESKKDGNSNGASTQQSNQSQGIYLHEDFHLMADDDDIPF